MSLALLLVAAATAHVVVPATPHRTLVRSPVRVRACAQVPPVDTVDATPVRHLLEHCLHACNSISELVETIYEMIGGSDGQGRARPGVAFKSDESYFTLADGLVQALLLRMLSGVVAEVVGEEDSMKVNIEAPPFQAGVILAPSELDDLIVRVRDEVDLIALQLRKSASPTLRKLTAFVDPIDGTREFCTGRGGACTICVGFCTDAGKVVAGLVYRPLEKPRSWAAGCLHEQYARLKPRAPLAPDTPPEMPPGTAAPRGRFLASGRGMSPFLARLGDELGLELLGVGGAGNKAMLLLEGVGACYVQDRGLSRWDTCAAQGVLEAHGGLLVKLTSFAATGALEPYAYRRTAVNLDFEPGACALTRYNAAPSVLLELAAQEAAAADAGVSAPPRYAQTPEEVTPYANTCGVLALPSRNAEELSRFREAIARATGQHAPSYD